MKSNWFSGPAFLWEKEISSGEEKIPDIQIGDPEVKATVRTTKVKESFSLIDCVTILQLGHGSWSSVIPEETLQEEQAKNSYYNGS